MTEYIVNEIAYYTMAEALQAAGAETEIACYLDGKDQWTKETDRFGALWLDAGKCSMLDDADLIALINSQPESDETSLTELLSRGGKNADDYDDIGVMYLEAKQIAEGMGYELKP